VAFGANSIDLACHEAREVHPCTCLATVPVNAGNKNGFAM